jgi:hypothetical protein
VTRLSRLVPLLALFGPGAVARRMSVSSGKRTSFRNAPMTGFDPERTF